MSKNPQGHRNIFFRGHSVNHTSTPPFQSGNHHHSLSPESFPGLSPTPSLEDISSMDTPPPVLVSPIKRCAQAAPPTINKMSDLDMWNLSDLEIIGKLLAYYWPKI